MHNEDASAGRAERESHPWSNVFNIVVLIVGGAALAWMLRTISWDEVRRVVIGVGAWAGVLFGLDVVGLCCDAKALHVFMRPEARMVSYWRVLAAQASGRAINVLTPFGALGEATKVSMLVTHAPKARVLSSIVLYNFVVLYLSVAIMLIGIPITMLLVDLPSSLEVMIGIAVAVIVPLMITLAVLIHRGALSTLVGMLEHVRIIKPERAQAWKARVVEIDKHIRELQRHPTAGTRTGILLLLLSRAISTAATMLLMWAVGVELSPALVIGVLSVGQLIAWVSSIVPLGLGLADGGNFALYELLGASGQHGMFVTMLARARSVSIAIVGLAAMAVTHILTRLSLARMQRRLADLKAQAEAR